MFLLVDAISDPAIYVLFDEDRRVIDRCSFSIRGQESEQFFVTLEAFVGKNRQTLRDLSGIVIVNGPGGFTSMRIITLTVNTIAYVHRAPLYPIDFFAFAAYAGASFPMLLRANRGEYLLKASPEDEPRIVPNQEIPEGRYSGIAWENDFENTRISIQSSLDHDTFIRQYVFGKSQHRIDPIYIKKPNIVIKTHT